MAFQHIPSEVGAVEAEEVGVEHLLRDIHDPSVSTMGSNVNAKLLALKSLVEHLKEVQAYLNNVCEGKLPINQKIVGQLQDIFNLLPNLNVEEMIRSFAVKTNDMMMVIYLSSLIRSIIALHNLINNKVPLLVSLCSCLCSSRSLPFRSVLTVRSSLSLDRLQQSLRAAEVGTKKVDKEEDKEKKGEKADSKEKEAKKTEEGANKKEKK